MDHDLLALRRATRAAPDDPEARARYHAALVRLEGDAFLPLLDDVRRWDGASEDEQDAALAAAARRLEPALRCEAVRWFEHARDDCFGCAGTGQETIGDEAAPRDRSALRLGTCSLCGGSGRPEVGGGRVVQRHRVAMFRHEANPWLLPTVEGVAAPDPGVAAWLAGHGLRLPTLSEWEAACFQGEEDPLHFPSPAPGHTRPCACAHPHPAARYAAHPNAYGLVEMLGNAWEQTSDGPAGGACIDPSLPWEDPRNDFARWVPERVLGLRVARSL